MVPKRGSAATPTDPRSAVAGSDMAATSAADHLADDETDHLVDEDDLTALFEFLEPLPAAPAQQATEALPGLAYPPLVLPDWFSCDQLTDLPTDAAELLTARAKDGKPGRSWMLSTFRVEGSAASATATILHECRPQLPPTEFHPFTTSMHLYVPCTFTLLSHLLARADALLLGKRVCELGAGLGLCSCVLGRLGATSRLVATDGCEASLPLLQANLEANCGAAVVETALLRWGRSPEPLAGSFDVVVASDAIFDVRPPGGASRMADTEGLNAANFRALFSTAAALLDPQRSASRLLLTVEPRDRLASDWVCRDMLAAAKAAGFACVEEKRRRLDGVCRPDWEVDVYAFALRESDPRCK